MVNTFYSVCFGVVIGMCISIARIEQMETEVGGGQVARDECEARLPRNQSCVMRWEPGPAKHEGSEQ